MAVTREKVVLKGLHSPIEWQCAHNLVYEHADPKQKVKITYGTPDGDLTLEAKPIGTHQWTVTKARAEK
jgi:hypothetical protein